MKLIKIKGYGASLGLKFVEPLEVKPTSRLALIGWYYSYETDEVNQAFNCGAFNCFEIHCNVVDACHQNYNENFKTPEEELLAICNYNKTVSCQFVKAKKAIFKGSYEPKNHLFINIKDGIRKIRNISIELKTNLGTNDIFEKVNSSIYLVLQI